MVDIFSIGEQQTLEDILKNKEQRESYKLKLLRAHQEQTLISVGFNIPGNIKNNEHIERGFNKVIAAFAVFLADNDLKIVFHEQFSNQTGPEAYFLIDSKMQDIKKVCIDYENLNQIGRLLDIDVYQMVNNQLNIIDRDLFKQPPRLCYLCAKPAKECTRQQTHHIEELRAKINEIFQEILSMNG